LKEFKGQKDNRLHMCVCVLWTIWSESNKSVCGYRTANGCFKLETLLDHLL